MRVLVACEFSGVVREAFRKRGHDAWSCDLVPSEVDGPHIMGDVLKVLGWNWDLLIAHPPCTFLSHASNVWINRPGRRDKREEAMGFLLSLANSECSQIAIENPPGYPARAWRRPDQTIHPYQFGHPVRKATCLQKPSLD